MQYSGSTWGNFAVATCQRISGDDSLCQGTNGDDTLIGGAGNDTLTGGDGDDRFVVGSPYSPSRDMIKDFSDGDRVDLSEMSWENYRDPTWVEIRAAMTADGSDVRLDLTSLAEADDGVQVSTFEGISISDLSASDFIGLSGGGTTPTPTPTPAPTPNPSPAATERGGATADTLNGGAGNDNVYGEGGDDALLAGAGNDYIHGGAGNDRLWGQDSDDGLDGGVGADFLAGGAGDDSLTGGAGADYLAGEAGNDTLDGGAGYDILAGGDGGDTLYGGTEGDTFFGQEGYDRFVIRGGVNWVMDFDEATDWLRIPGIETDSELIASATQVGGHVRIAFDDGDLYLAWTTVEDISGWPIVF